MVEDWGNNLVDTCIIGSAMASPCCESKMTAIGQQISELLTKQWALIKSETLLTALTSTGFLSRAKEILKGKFVASSVEQVCQPETIISAYQWLICYILEEMQNKITSKSIRERVYEKNLATVYLQYFCFQRLLEVIQIENIPPYIKEYILKLLYLYCLWSLKEFIPFFHRGRYMDANIASKLIKEGISKLVGDLKENVTDFVDRNWELNLNKRIQSFIFIARQLLSTLISQTMQFCEDSNEIEKSDLQCKL